MNAILTTNPGVRYFSKHPMTVLAAQAQRAPLTREAGLDSYQPSVRQRLQRLIQAVVENEASQGPWSSRDGMCLDLAAKWQQRLQAEGFEASIVAVDPGLAGHTLDLNGQRVPGKFHAFVAVQGEGETIVVDGSVQQFFEGPEVRSDLPSVFVGTVEEVAELFQAHRQDLRIEVAGDRYIGQYDPTVLADFVYGAGRYADARTVLN